MPDNDRNTYVDYDLTSHTLSVSCSSATATVVEDWIKLNSTSIDNDTIERGMADDETSFIIRLSQRPRPLLEKAIRRLIIMIKLHDQQPPIESTQVCFRDFMFPLPKLTLSPTEREIIDGFRSCPPELALNLAEAYGNSPA